MIYHALRNAIYQHPALSVVIDGKDTPRPFFRRLDTTDLKETVNFEDIPSDEVDESKHIDEMLSREHSTGFGIARLPLWRVVVLEKPETEAKPTIHLAFIWHHVIGDGRSGLAVLSTILQAFQSFHEQKENRPRSTIISGTKLESLDGTDHGVVITPSKPLLPSLEEILLLPMSARTIISQKLGLWVPSWFSRPPASGKWSGRPYHWKESIRTKVRHIRIPYMSVQGVVNHCRAERTTMTPFLQALVGRVITEVLQDAVWLRCAVALSLRRFFSSNLRIDDNVMGLWVSAFHSEYTRNQLQDRDAESSLWNQAREYSQQFEHEIAKGATDLEIGMLRYIQDFKSDLMAKMDKQRQDSYAITNLGVFEPELGDEVSSTSPWRLTGTTFSQSCHVNGSAVQFCIVTFKGGPMCIALTWQEGIVADEDVARMAEKLRDELMHLADSSAT
jgi:Alcohol acetyltransferase